MNARIRLSLLYVYTYIVITSHRSVFLSPSLTLKRRLHSFFSLFQDETPRRRRKRVFSATSQKRITCIPLDAAVHTTSVLTIRYANIMETQQSAGA